MEIGYHRGKAQENCVLMFFPSLIGQAASFADHRIDWQVCCFT
jgi:hypothetical protein